MLTTEESREVVVMNTELEKLCRDRAPGTDTKPPTSVHDIQMARMFLSMLYSVKRSTKPKRSSRPHKTHDIQIPVRDGSTVPARVYTPRKPAAQGCPCMYVCHGGSYMVGELDTEEWQCELFASMGGVVVDVLYRHAPEYPFPIPVQDSYDGLQWVAQNLVDLNVNPSKGFIVSGSSNGADIALVIAHLYAQEQLLCPPLTGLYLACPMVMEKETVPEKYRAYFNSWEQNSNAMLMSTQAVEFVDSVYKPDKTSPLASPMLFPDHSKLPKTYLQVCGMDPLRDGGLILEQVLKDSGVAVKTDLYPGLPHCFWGPFIHAEFTKRHGKDTADGLAWLLAA